jgi:signal transduction histidine kinase
MKSLERIPVRYRLAVGHTIWLIILFIGLGCGLFRVVESNFNESTDNTLRSQANLIQEAKFGQKRNFAYFFHRFFSDPIDVDEMFGRRHIRTYARMVSSSGNVSHRTKDFRVNLPVTPLALKRAEKGKNTFETFKFKNNTPIRVYTMPVIKFGKFTGDLIQVGTSLEATQHALKGVSTILWFSLPIGLAFSVIFGYFLTKRALNPVRIMTNTAKGLSIQDLGVRLPIPSAKDEIRELAETFNSMMDRLEDSVKRLRRFTGDVSHELRTPLAVLRAEAEFAIRKERPAEQYKEALGKVLKESIHMSSIIEDLLLLARAESKSVAMNWQKLEVSRFMEKIIHDTDPDYKKRSVDLKLDLEDGIGFIEASDNFLGLALRNIIANAAKHSAYGDTVAVKVYSSFSPAGSPGVSFEIIDRGEGIPEEDLPNIFDPFFRSDTARNRAAGGVGIGLSLAMALIKLHSGCLKVDSQVGYGTTFKVFIPQMGICDELPEPGKHVTLEEESKSTLEILPTS